MLKEEIIQLGKKIGFELVKFCKAEPFLEYEKIVKERIKLGYYPEELVSYEEILRNIEQYSNPTYSLPNAQTIIILGFSYNIDSQSIVTKLGEPRGEIARTYHKDIYGELKKRTKKMARVLRNKGIKVAVKSMLPLKQAAIRAGLGWQGKNSLIQTEEYGSWILLAGLIIDKELPVDEPLERDCGSCQACIKACPTNAIIAPGLVDFNKCIDYLTIKTGIIPRELREKIGNRIIGCDRCQEVCPNNRKAKIVEKKFPSLKKNYREKGELIPLLKIPQREVERYFSNVDLIEVNRDILLRNVIVALGNLRDPIAIPFLAGLLLTSSDLVRIHAIWALGRFREIKIKRLLQNVLKSENENSIIKEEILVALNKN